MQTPIGRVLLVDDDDRLRALVERALVAAGGMVTSAPGGQDALRAIVSEPFDVIVMDVEMPPPDGFQTLKAIRTVGCAVPVLLVSGADHAERARASGVAFLAKPFAMDVLLQAIARARSD